ncbi:MAG: glutamine-hydrolyzing carbamoyl-phosphate synthase small subunit [Erysipelotrichaceae bacterium]|nr:glutamine-hydrolyzing carbamoyl-phosphate synthase small subunit [Erysipelotrichaceae bacterium]
MKKHEKAYLVLSDGTVYEGKRFGASCNRTGELVFTTGMCGYIETLTDPSYGGQIVIQTFPLIGNYGIIPDDFEGEPALFGYCVREYCEKPSNFRCEKTLDDYLKEKNIPGIYGIDTRALTVKIRESGVVNAGIFDHVPQSLDEIVSYRVAENVVSQLSTDRIIEKDTENQKYHVVLMDFGAKKNIIEELRKRGVHVSVVPADTSAESILAMNPDGIMLSNGPGDPADNVQVIAQLKKLIGVKPVFGICLGHQMAALALGASTYKLKYGHRGANQPVKDLLEGRTYITTQNHGYAVDTDTLPEDAVLRYVNANDGTCEGIDYPKSKCFTVQFHPEACAGPKDTGFLFDRFIQMMEEG